MMLVLVTIRCSMPDCLKMLYFGRAKILFFRDIQGTCITFKSYPMSNHGHCVLRLTLACKSSNEETSVFTLPSKQKFSGTPSCAYYIQSYGPTSGGKLILWGLALITLLFFFAIGSAAGNTSFSTTLLTAWLTALYTAVPASFYTAMPAFMEPCGQAAMDTALWWYMSNTTRWACYAARRACYLYRAEWVTSRLYIRLYRWGAWRKTQTCMQAMVK